MLEGAFYRGHLGLHLDPAQADLLNKRQWCSSQDLPPCSWPLPGRSPHGREPTCRLTGYSAAAPRTGSGWHRVPPSAPPQLPTPRIG